MNRFSLFSELLALGALPPAPVVAISEVQLPEEWIEFEKTLGTFKDEYVKTRRDMNGKEADYIELSNDVSLMKDTLSQIKSMTLREHITECVHDHAEEVDLDVKKEELSLLAGKVKAMEMILQHTNAWRYNQFTCPICMDKLVGIFLNPCGHLVCDACLMKLRDSKCPTCRTENVIGCRMFTS